MKKQNSFFWIALIMILMAALMRLWIYPANFSPVIAMALFGGAVFKDKKMAFLLPLLAMFISDAAMEYSGIATGFWGWGQVAGYCILGLITILAFSMKKINVKNVLLYAIGASLFLYAEQCHSLDFRQPSNVCKKLAGFCELYGCRHPLY